MVPLLDNTAPLRNHFVMALYWMIVLLSGSPLGSGSPEHFPTFSIFLCKSWISRFANFCSWSGIVDKLTSNIFCKWSNFSRASEYSKSFKLDPSSANWRLNWSNSDILKREKIYRGRWSRMNIYCTKRIACTENLTIICSLEKRFDKSNLYSQRNSSWKVVSVCNR